MAGKEQPKQEIKECGGAYLKSVRNSRERIREKYKALQKENQSLERQVHGLKKQILRFKTGSLSVKRHHYDAAQISLCVNLRNSTNSSLRSCLQIIRLVRRLLIERNVANFILYAVKNKGTVRLFNKVQDKIWSL